jgi:glycosyltransferase involved in cell wall biosynthesis
MKIAVVVDINPKKNGASKAVELRVAEIYESLGISHQITEVKICKKDKKWRFLSDLKQQKNEFFIEIGLFQSLILHRVCQNTRRFSDMIVNSRLNYFSRFVRKQGFDLIIFPGPSIWAIYFPKCPVISSVWDIGHVELPNLLEFKNSRYSELRNLVIFKTMNLSRFITTESEYLREILGNKFLKGGDKLVSIPFLPSGTIMKLGLVEAKNENELDFALYPANSWSHKNHLVLFKAMSNIISRGEVPRKLILTGFQYQQSHKLLEFIEKFSLTNFVEIKGNISNLELYSYYKTCKLLVMPSLLGPTNLPPLEAVYLGKPVFVSTSHKYDSSLINFFNFVDPYAPEDWEICFDKKSVFASPNESIVFKAFEKIKIENQFKWKKMVDIIEFELQF